VFACFKEETVFIHIFGFHWKASATDAEKVRAAGEIRAFQGVIPGLIDVAVGENLSPRGQGYTFAGVDAVRESRCLRCVCDACGAFGAPGVACSANWAGGAGFWGL